MTKTNRFIRSNIQGFPHITKEGRWLTTVDGLWTGGFWVGQLWWLWKYTGNITFRSAAERYRTLLESCEDADTIDFDALPESQHVRDTSASAIVLASQAQARRWRIPVPTEDMLEKRTWQGLFLNYLAPDDEDGVLTAGCFHYPRGEGIRVATVWGDYYLLEALVDSCPSCDEITI